MRKSALTSLMLVLLSLYVTACSTQATTSPTAPTAAVSASGDSTISPARLGGGNGGSGSGGSGSGSSGGGSGNSGGSGSDHGGGSGGGPGSGHDDSRVELNGIAESVAGQCPTLKLTVAGQMVTTAASTEFTHGPCSALATGQRLEVRGTMQPGGVVLAARIEGEERDDDDDDDDEDANDDEIVGEIASVTGICPALTLTVGTVTITTTGDTRFDDVECGDLATGMTIEAKGVRQSDVNLLASKVERKPIY